MAPVQTQVALPDEVGAFPERGHPVNEKRPAAFGLADTPFEEKELNVVPLAVGTGVGSVGPPLPDTTFVNGYVAENG